MLAALVRFSIERRAVVFVAAAVLVAYGVFALRGAGLDIFPEFAPKLVVVQTEAPGFSAEQVEQRVTRVLESERLTTGPEVERFEEALAKTVGARGAVAVSSGTAALHAACFAAGVRPGDEVVVSYDATFSNVSFVRSICRTAMPPS